MQVIASDLLIPLGAVAAFIVAAVTVAWRVRGWIAAAEAQQKESFASMVISQEKSAAKQEVALAQLASSIQGLNASVTVLSGRLDGYVTRTDFELWLERARIQNQELKLPRARWQPE